MCNQLRGSIELGRKQRFKELAWWFRELQSRELSWPHSDFLTDFRGPLVNHWIASYAHVPGDWPALHFPFSDIFSRSFWSHTMSDGARYYESKVLLVVVVYVVVWLYGGIVNCVFILCITSCSAHLSRTAVARSSGVNRSNHGGWTCDNNNSSWPPIIMTSGWMDGWVCWSALWVVQVQRSYTKTTLWGV